MKDQYIKVVVILKGNYILLEKMFTDKWLVDGWMCGQLKSTSTFNGTLTLKYLRKVKSEEMAFEEVRQFIEITSLELLDVELTHFFREF